MLSAEELYNNDAWRASRARTNQWSARVYFCTLANYGYVKSHLDVGCGDGHLSRIGAALSIYSVGMDASVEDAEEKYLKLQRVDLSKPINLHRVFDLVTSWEVGEHIEDVSSDVFVDNIVRHVDKHLVFSAAVPGQGGYHHVNEQPNSYWIDKFEARELKYLHYRTIALRFQLKHVCGPCWWYANNMMCFTKE